MDGWMDLLVLVSLWALHWLLWLRRLHVTLGSS
jgi:hypothetical protein